MLACAVALATTQVASAQAPASAAGLAFVDPLVAAKPYRPGKNPLARQLSAAEARYARTWGALPRVPVPGGPDLQPGASGPRVTALRERLGVGGRGPYDEGLADQVARFQAAHGLPPTGVADAVTLQAVNAGPEPYQRAIAASLARARMLPPSFGKRYIIVDAASGELTYYDGGRLRATMKVVVGKPSQPTPMMVGMVRTLIFNPYWNVPEDLVRTSIATKVLAQGQKYVREEGLQVLSDYSDRAVELDPAKVNWRGVARGDVTVRVRQRPGPKNMMGRVKLMLPNPLGVYLHDTPFKEDFGKAARLESSGCIRLEDAMGLARLLVGEEVAEGAADGAPEEHVVALRKPAPVYVTYFTAMPRGDGLEFRRDVYGRDAAAGITTAAAGR